MSSFQSNPLTKKEDTFYSVNEESKQTVFETSNAAFLNTCTAGASTVSVKRQLGVGVSFFPTFFTILYIGK